MTDLRKYRFFKDMSDDKIREALSFFDAREAKYVKGELICGIYDTLDFFGIVLQGIIQVCIDDIDGQQMIMATVGENDAFGESLCYLKKKSHVYICAVTDAVILKMSTNNIETNPDSDMVRRFISLLAERTLTMNDRIQVLSKHSIREKIIMMLSQYVGNTQGNTVELPFDRNSLSLYLGCDRTALSRELSHMKKDGIIEVYKNKITIIKPVKTH